LTGALIQFETTDKSPDRLILRDLLRSVKVAKFLSTWQWDGKSHAGIRKKLFEGETVETLSAKIKVFEKKHGK